MTGKRELTAFSGVTAFCPRRSRNSYPPRARLLVHASSVPARCPAAPPRLSVRRSPSYSSSPPSSSASQYALVYKGFSLHQDDLLYWQLPAQLTGDKVTKKKIKKSWVGWVTRWVGRDHRNRITFRTVRILLFPHILLLCPTLTPPCSRSFLPFLHFPHLSSVARQDSTIST